MTNIKVTKNNNNEAKIGVGIKVKNPHKFRIAGAVLRVEVKPHSNGFGADYKLRLWLPNKVELAMDDTHGYVAWGDFMEALVEASTGQKVKTGNEEKTYTVAGLPLVVRESVDDLIEDIKPTETVDPTKEKVILLPPPGAITTTTIPSKSEGLYRPVDDNIYD